MVTRRRREELWIVVPIYGVNVVVQGKQPLVLCGYDVITKKKLHEYGVFDSFAELVEFAGAHGIQLPPPTGGEHAGH